MRSSSPIRTEGRRIRVRQIVEQHGGTIEVTSAVGRGSTFTIRFPRATVLAALTAAN